MSLNRKLFFWPLIFLFALSFTFFAASAGAAEAQDMDIPDYQGWVNDFAGILNADTIGRLDDLIEKTETDTTAEIAVVTINSLEGWEIEDYAIELFSQWGIGKKEKDNGVLLLIAVEERTLRIEVGYGLEGALTDLESGDIINNIILPRFRDNDYNGGIYSGVSAIAGNIYNEYGLEFETQAPVPASAPAAASSTSPPLFLICCLPFIFIIAVIIFLFNLFTRRCPKCRRFFKLRTKHTILEKATYKQGGKKLVEKWCSACDFREKKVVSIPKKTHSSSSGWSGGGFGGGSSGGGGASGRW